MKRIIFLLILLVSPIFAQLEGNPENWCRNGAFPRESKNYSLGNVKAKKGERIYFYGDDENCPNGKNCRQKSYLIAGNEVIISRKFGEWACVWYQPKKGYETVGWISLKNLEFLNLDKSTDSLAGSWKFYDNEIQIKKSKNLNTFEVKGNAFWKGSANNVHVGELDGKAVWNSETLKYGEDDKDEFACKVTFNLVGNYLIVSDNMNCGGANVTFSGVYLKKLTR
ncbi:MAG: hypothetical protein K1X72_03555 [Pyrinomonadaceae bacterium]|nr:hypothetical protein [Pyrinomonadaceae bacterium]